MQSSLFKTGVLLVNLGTPDSTAVPDVRRYLREFLMDGRVIDVSYPQRFALVNGIIAPFRAPKSAHEYEKLWDQEKGSPLKYYGFQLRDLLQEALGQDFVVELAMRYQNPSIPEVLQKLQACSLKELIIIPLFPQYASATSGSVIDKVMEIVRGWQIIPSIQYVGRFVEEELYLQALTARAKPYLEMENWDHYLFSYHGVPERQIYKGSCGDYCKIDSVCCATYTPQNQYCYRAQCYYNSRLLAERLGLKQDQYSTCFQSRLGKDPWIQPYADDVIPALAKSGKKKVLAFSPAFVADCLETTVEVGETFKDNFIEAGGERWELVESLNDHPLWVQCLQEIVLRRSGK
ncbi:ferrochelatase [Flammeovirgaceae bacterium 311]|nr:ferrochelatase [Flammeovirgaceae bacterium 311]